MREIYAVVVALTVAAHFAFVGYEDGFIDHYLTGVLYPASLENLVLALVLIVVVTSWILFALRTRRPGGGSGVRGGLPRIAAAVRALRSSDSARGSGGR